MIPFHSISCSTRAANSTGRFATSTQGKEQPDPKKREAYYAKHKTEIEAFKDARDYINTVMNGRTDPPPIKEWRTEQTKLTAAKYSLCERYYALQDEVWSVEQLRKGAENII